MRILCCGDRHWKDYYVIHARLSVYKDKDVTIIHGNALGADRMSAQVAIELGLSIKSFQAEWARYGKAAGPIRNQRMLDEGRPDLVLAFHNDIRNSKGTKDMINRTKRTSIPYEIITL